MENIQKIDISVQSICWKIGISNQQFSNLKQNVTKNTVRLLQMPKRFYNVLISKCNDQIFSEIQELLKFAEDQP